MKNKNIDIIRHVERHWNGLSAGPINVIEDYPDRFRLEGFDSPEPTDANHYKNYLTTEEVEARIQFLQQVLADAKKYKFFDTDAKAFGDGERYDYD